MKDSGLWDFERMKTKNFCLVLGLIAFSTGIIWLLGSPSPSTENVVVKTHRDTKNIPTNTQTRYEGAVDPIYLSRLGLEETQQGQVITDAENSNSGDEVQVGQPVIGTSVDGKDWEGIIMFWHSVSRHMPGYRLVMFDIGSSELIHLMLLKYCNSTWNCQVHKFEFDKYPSHVADLSIKSYRPICIQELLNRYGAVIWVDSAEYFRSGNITSAVERAKSVGLAAWTVEDPTSAITHPKMFDFFHKKQDQYYFHRAVESSHLIIFNTPLVKQRIMLPWVRCALLPECISPTGVQNTGCNFMRKPLFQYSGCHYYDMSALNVILGSVFEFDERAYAATDNIFGNFIDDLLAAKNATSNPLHRSRLKRREYLNGRTVETS